MEEIILDAKGKKRKEAYENMLQNVRGKKKLLVYMCNELTLTRCYKTDSMSLESVTGAFIFFQYPN